MARKGLYLRDLEEGRGDIVAKDVRDRFRNFSQGPSVNKVIFKQVGRYSRQYISDRCIERMLWRQPKLPMRIENVGGLPK